LKSEVRAGKYRIFVSSVQKELSADRRLSGVAGQVTFKSAEITLILLFPQA
jgi:hypothetical protein